MAVVGVFFVVVSQLTHSVDARRPLPRVAAGAALPTSVHGGGGLSLAMSSSSGASALTSGYQSPMPLAVWIDERQIERLIGRLATT